MSATRDPTPFIRVLAQLREIQPLTQDEVTTLRAFAEGASLALGSCEECYHFNDHALGCRMTWKPTNAQAAANGFERIGP